MGLDTTHDAFSGAYSAFNRFRQVVARAMGGSFPPHEDKTLNDDLWYYDDEFGEETHPGLYAFMTHSDCDGILTPEECQAIADEMEKLLPKIAKAGSGGGHIARDGGFEAVAKRFIAGCRAAVAADEPIEFL